MLDQKPIKHDNDVAEPEPIRHEGLNRHRFGQNPLERIFAEQWESCNEYTHLAHILSIDNKPASISQRDATVAATVIHAFETAEKAKI